MAKSTISLLVHTLQELRLLGPSQLQQVSRSLQGQYPEAPLLCQELVRRGWLTPWQAQQLSQARTSDLRLGPYLMLDLLGGGGNGQVFKARHDKMNRLVAVKMLRPDLANDHETVQRFHREIEVIGQLSHPNIVHALEAGPVGSVLALVTEFVEGVDLERLVRQAGPLPAIQACDFIRQAARGLAHAHTRGLVHRDIKPSNLILSRPRSQAKGAETIKQTAELGTIKILDLGLARLQQPAQGSTTSNLTMLGGTSVMQGTPDYMSPEQALDFHSADCRSDLYSLGCTLYFLLAGQPPFPGGSLAEKLMRHQMVKPPPLERTDLPDGLVGLLAKLLAKRPLDRYQTPAELDRALTELVAKERNVPGGSAITTPSLVLTGTDRRRRGLVIGVAGGLALAGILAWTVLFRGSKETSGIDSAIRGPRPTPPAVLVTDVSAATKKPYSTTTARVGAICYIDRAYKILELGRSLEGGTLIQTANDDKHYQGGDYLSFTLEAPAVIHVVADSQYARLPAWLDDSTWHLTPETVTFEGQGRAYKVYRKQAAAGRVTVGGGGQAPSSGAGGNYFVIVQSAR